MHHSIAYLKRNINCIVIFCFIFLSSCASYQENLSNVDTTNLQSLQSVRVNPQNEPRSYTTLSQMRISVLKDTAMSIGAQGGLAWASDQMDQKMDHDRKYLDSIFNFYGMVLSHGVIPPVLEYGDNSLHLDDPNTIRIADRTYRIVKQARFATTPPNWREYLWMSYGKPELPNKTLLPRTAEEQKIWEKYVQKGWEKGIQQSYSIFYQNLARLKRDYAGMALYRKLLQERMITAPFVARTRLGITGNGNDMRINDQVLRIVEHPQLQTDYRHWNAIVVKH